MPISIPSFSSPSDASAPRRRQGILAAVALALLVAGVALLAQVSGDRGIAPVASSTDIEVNGVEVNVTGDSPEHAREKGWEEAARIAWKRIGGADISDSQLDSLISAIVVERERLGPRRYIATLGVVFDRQRAGSLLGGQGERSRSAPMLTLPVLVSGGSATMFETQNPWQRAWAQYQAGASAIDYVRPVGAGGDSLLLTNGQTGRRSRLWWNNVLDQFGAADVLVPIAELTWRWPGGPVDGRFTARHGPDNRFLGEFTMSAGSPAELPDMMNRAVRQMNTIYTRALASGTLQPDPTLSLDAYELTPEILALIEAGQRREAAERDRAAGEQPAPVEGAAGAGQPPLAQPGEGAVATVNSFNVQVATPDAAAFDGALSGLRGTPGIRAVATGSLAVGGTSVLRVDFAGDVAALAAALRARGWQVTQSGSTLAISR